MLASGEQPDATPIMEPLNGNAAADEVAGHEDEVGSLAADSITSSEQAAGGIDQPASVSAPNSSVSQTVTHDSAEL